jgi:hypothetical protein
VAEVEVLILSGEADASWASTFTVRGSEVTCGGSVEGGCVCLICTTGGVAASAVTGHGIDGFGSSES